MEPSTTQETNASPLTSLSNNTVADLLGGSDPLDTFTDPLTLTPAKTESSNVSSAIENSLFTEKSDSSPSHVKPQLEKEIEISSKDTVISEPDTIAAVTDFLNEAKSKPEEIPEPAKEVKPETELFGFNKPLPPEPFESSSDFLKSEVTTEIKRNQEKEDDGSEFVGAASDSPVAISREDSPIPPPIPKHQNLRDESPDRFESSPEPDFKPMELSKDDEEIIKPRPVTPVKPVEVVKEAPKKEEKTPSVGDIGAKDIIVEIVEVTERHRRHYRFFQWLLKETKDFFDAWFNPARLHPQVESLVYWRDPKKSGAVFGVLMVTLLSLTCFSLISVVAYLSLLTLAGTISFRTYKSIMQAVQKTSDGHPFKEYLDLDISMSEEKVSETARIAAQHLNAAISALRSLFLVEDLVDSIKGLVLFWALTYVGAVFNGLTLLIIGVVLIFSLPRLYEKNKAQVDAYIQIGMDKLSIITNRMKAAIPSGKKEEKPKDQ